MAAIHHTHENVFASTASTGSETVKRLGGHSGPQPEITFFGANSHAAYGNKMHKAYSAEKKAAGYVTNSGLPDSRGRLRPDAYKMNGRYIAEVREYKPDSPSGLAHGRKQLRAYVDYSEKYNRAIAAEAGPTVEPPKLKWYLDEYPSNPTKKK
ncbi:hypothetical protein CGLAU_01190 [Corynebacterium glaucum]|uniref:Tox-REase-9 domain-containing protein n=1 Tax=Corynebacterium glaucum TaxID=187491 RepID=A0A1Q2HTR7_9CORY|nr:hypothetical protein [Corynebacterium glaucum]AQQ14229.1 hypothetical protein CGLAU_01190 [Corynebacterium glaucum]WJZ06752.1 hypothetical protein CGLAUT_01210 [Corynebacterium glaucum]